MRGIGSLGDPAVGQTLLAMGSPTMTSAPIVQLSGVRKHFGSMVAVDDLDLVVAGGGLVAVLEPNGAGKTTTLPGAEERLTIARIAVAADRQSTVEALKALALGDVKVSA
jgi:ABC-type branched-subunit amino acid transport system ATPase component